MKINELLTAIDPDTLVWIAEETNNGPEGIYCCPLGDLTLGDIKPYRNRSVKQIYPEKYGKYYGFTGISIIIEKAT